MTTSLAFKAAQLLRGAREYLSNPDKWIKRNIQRGDKVCSIGAIQRAAGFLNGGWKLGDPQERAERHLAYGKAVDALSLEVGGNIPLFNDNPSTKHEDVLAAFDLAIEKSCKVVQQEAAKSGEKDSTS